MLMVRLIPLDSYDTLRGDVPFTLVLSPSICKRNFFGWHVSPPFPCMLGVELGRSGFEGNRKTEERRWKVPTIRAKWP